MRTVTRRRLAAATVASLIVGTGVFDARAIDRSTGCTIDSASAISLGSYDPNASGPVDVQGRIVYQCGNQRRLTSNRAVKKKLQISLSTGLAGTYNRQMYGARDRLNYNVYLDPQRIVIWGDGTGASQVFSDNVPANGSTQVVPVFGRLFANQDVWYGTYFDNLVITIDF